MPKTYALSAIVSLLIKFYLGLNLYKAYAFSTYGAKKGEHIHVKAPPKATEDCY